MEDYIPDLTCASGITDTMLVLPSIETSTCKSEVVDNIGLQSHGSAARLFCSNTGMALSQQSTTGQFHGVSQPMNARDTGYVTNPCMTLTDPLISNRSIHSVGTTSQVTSTFLPAAPYL